MYKTAAYLASITVIYKNGLVKRVANPQSNPLGARKETMIKYAFRVMLGPGLNPGLLFMTLL